MEQLANAKTEVLKPFAFEEMCIRDRFDIGDGEGDLIAPIKNFYDYCLSPNCQMCIRDSRKYAKSD